MTIRTHVVLFSFQMTLMILGCFTLCWCPFLIITLYARLSRDPESSTLYEIFFNLAMINSSLNPLIYSWKNSNFRRAFLSLLKCHSPDRNHTNNYITNHVPSKRNSENGICNMVYKEANETKGNNATQITNKTFPYQKQNCESLSTISKDIEDDLDSGLQMSTIQERESSV